MKTSTRLASITLESPDGSPVPLAALWREKPALIAWVRHFG
jgi:hypothetical protein